MGSTTRRVIAYTIAGTMIYAIEHLPHGMRPGIHTTKYPMKPCNNILPIELTMGYCIICAMVINYKGPWGLHAVISNVGFTKGCVPWYVPWYVPVPSVSPWGLYGMFHHAYHGIPHGVITPRNTTGIQGKSYGTMVSHGAVHGLCHGTHNI